MNTNCYVSHQRKSLLKSASLAQSTSRFLTNAFSSLKSKLSSLAIVKAVFQQTTSSRLPLPFSMQCQSAHTQSLEASSKKICMKDDQLDRRIQKIKKRYDRKHSSAIVDYLDEALKGRFPVKETEPDLDYCPIALTIEMMNNRRGLSKVCRLRDRCHRHDKGTHVECGRPYKLPKADDNA